MLYSSIPVKAIQIGKEDIRLSLFIDDVILYVEDPKQATKKLLVIRHKFSKVTGHKINIQKSNSFLYSSNEYSKMKF